MKKNPLIYGGSAYAKDEWLRGYTQFLICEPLDTRRPPEYLALSGKRLCQMDNINPQLLVGTEMNKQNQTNKKTTTKEDDKPSTTQPQPQTMKASASNAVVSEEGVVTPVKETINPEAGKNKDRLSGAAYKRYRFLIKAGYETTEAKRLAHLKKEEFLVPKKDGLPQTSKRQRSQDDSLRDAKKTKQGTPSAQPKKSEARRHKDVSYKNALVGTKMAVMSRRFPSELLTTEQMDLIGSSIMDIVEEKRDEVIKPKFLNSVYKAGYIMLLCKDEATVEWLKAVAVNLHPWDGSELWATKEVDIPQGSTLVGFFPNSAELPADRILNRIQGQNDGVNTSNWRVIRKEARGTSVLLILSLDQKSADSVEAQGRRLSYGFKEVPVKLRKPHEPPLAEESPIPQEEMDMEVAEEEISHTQDKTSN